MIKLTIAAVAISLSSIGCSLAKSTIVPESFLPCQDQDREQLRLHIPNLVFSPLDRVARQKVDILVMSRIDETIERIAWKNPMHPYGWHIQHTNSMNGPDFFETPEGRLVDRFAKIYEVRTRSQAYLPILVNSNDDVVGYGRPTEYYKRISTKCFYKANPPL